MQFGCILLEMMCLMVCIARLHDLLPLDSKLKGSNVVEACCRISNGSRSRVELRI